MSSDPQVRKNLEHDLESLKRDLNALQIEVTSSSKPWYKKASTLIALIALVFSLGTTAVSYIRVAQQDILASRLELRSLIDRFSSIPELHARMLKEYEDDPQTVYLLSATLNNRNLVLARQAQNTVMKIEKSAFGRNSVLAEEYTAVAGALQNSFLSNDAAAMYREATKRAVDPTVAAGILRSMAGGALVRLDVDTMRNEMTRARAIFDNQRFQSTPQITKDFTNATTELQWASGELQLGNCQLADTHIVAAEQLISQIPEYPGRMQLTGLLAEAKAALLVCEEKPL